MKNPWWKKDSVKLRIGVRCLAFSMEMVYLYIFQFSGFASSAQGFNEYLGRTGNAAQMHVVSRFHRLDCFVRRNEMYLFPHQCMFL